MLATLTPKQLLLASWVMLAAAGVLTTFRAFEGVAVAVGLLLLCGYPYALILGLPNGVVGASLRAWTRALFFGFLLALALLAVLGPFLPTEYSAPGLVTQWLRLLAALAINIVIFAPFFLGAAALNDLLRAARKDLTLQSIPNFLALYFGIFGGWLYVHRRVREALDVG